MRIARTLALVGLIYALPANCQWTPVKAKVRRISYEGTRVLQEFRGIYVRASNGSSLTLLRPVVDGVEKGEGRATLRDTSAGRVYDIDHDAKIIRGAQQIRTPQLPKYDRKWSGEATIRGLACRSVPVKREAPDEPPVVSGVAWFAEGYDLLVRQESESPAGFMLLQELYDIQLGVEPPAEMFAKPRGYK